MKPMRIMILKTNQAHSLTKAETLISVSNAEAVYASNGPSINIMIYQQLEVEKAFISRKGKNTPISVLANLLFKLMTIFEDAIMNRLQSSLLLIFRRRFAAI